jgi:hypothetical protein
MYAEVAEAHAATPPTAPANGSAHSLPLTDQCPEKPRSTTIEESSSVPVWDSERRELRFRNRLVKRYRVPAPNQELILAAFQEEGWPNCIDDPLHPGDQDPQRRLQATVKSLNRNQVAPLLRFRGNGNGDRVCWGVGS